MEWERDFEHCSYVSMCWLNLSNLRTLKLFFRSLHDLAIEQMGLSWGPMSFSDSSCQPTETIQQLCIETRGHPWAICGAQDGTKRNKTEYESCRAWHEKGLRQPTCCLVSHCSKELLVGGLEHFSFFYILGTIIPTDFHIFQRGWNHQPE